jgi:hypothetical protein
MGFKSSAPFFGCCHSTLSVETIDVDNFDWMFTREADETFLRQLDVVSESAVQLWPFISFEDADIWKC